MYLTNINNYIQCKKIYNFREKNIKITAITSNTKEIKKSSIFVLNSKIFKNSYHNELIKKNPAGIITDKYFKNLNIPQFFVKDVNLNSSLLLKKILPYSPLNTIAITGTNGKTSVVWYISQICINNFIKIKTHGTLGYFIDGKKKIDTDLTTPNFDILHQFAYMKRKNSYNFAFEASSHALHQNRLYSLPVSIAALTNISHDHLDYHKNLRDYKLSKYKLFTEHLSDEGFAILNEKIKNIEYLKNNMKAKKIITYGKKNSDVFLQKNSKKIEVNIFKKKFIKNIDINSKIELENISCAIACCLCMKIKTSDIVNSLSSILCPPGRLEKVTNDLQKFSIYVDYAHTPDALKNILLSLTNKNQKPNIVFGCGGDRDKSKRIMMGRIANNFANKVYITDDNPRGENPKNIRKSILLKCKKASEISDRKEAIKQAIKDLSDNDVLIIAGKGHEKKQIFRNKIKLFDDKKIVQHYLKTNV